MSQDFGNSSDLESLGRPSESCGNWRLDWSWRSHGWLPEKLKGVSERLQLSHMWPSLRHCLLSSHVRLRERILKPLCLVQCRWWKVLVCTVYTQALLIGWADSISNSQASSYAPGDCYTDRCLCKAFSSLFCPSVSHQASRRQTEILLSCIYGLFVVVHAGWARRLELWVWLVCDWLHFSWVLLGECAEWELALSSHVTLSWFLSLIPSCAVLTYIRCWFSAEARLL